MHELFIDFLTTEDAIDQHWLLEAYHYALENSGDSKTKKGVIISTPKIVICGTNYMSNNSHGKHIHAEADAITQASEVQLSIVGSTLYTTHPPCKECSTKIIDAQIGKVIIHNPNVTLDSKVNQQLHYHNMKLLQTHHIDVQLYIGKLPGSVAVLSGRNIEF